MQTPEQITAADSLLPVQAGVLLVEPEVELCESRRLLLVKIAHCVDVVRGYKEVFSLHPGNGYNLIVLNARHNNQEARDVSEYVRRCWPAAKVLLVGEDCGCIDDPLYDEIVDATGNPPALMAALQRLLKPSPAGRA